MDSKVAKERLSAVVKPDSITASQEDFLATHVPIKRLHLLNKFDILPSSGKEYTEEQVYKRIIKNPQSNHQFVAVYGQSGTGKSHTIRWFEARFEREKPENEVVLFIRRSDNTLKGTIRQLLQKPEVQNIANKEVFDRLSRASVSVEENKLKDLIYRNFIVELDNDDDSHELTLNNVKRKRLKAFLNNEVVEERLMGENGPIERMYSKIAESTLVDRDTIAQFVAEDFEVSVDFIEDISRAGADPKAIKMARSLMADEDGYDEAQKIANYLNQFVNDVIQRCAGIEPGDFRQIFQDIRRELYRLGKNLTLFIEDVTSFTGVDDALLDALIVEHTGMNEGDQICRISSIVGTTSNYLQNNFRDNHKDRITQYIFIPSDVFDLDGLYEFVGRYLNTMSLPQEILSKWLSDGANLEQYPVHEVKEGKNWEFVTDSYGKELCLYPFTKNSIRYLYRYVLALGHQTPRYIIRDLIEPVVTDILYNKKIFPSTKFKIVNLDTTLSFMIHNQVNDEAQADRILHFLSIWGDGTHNQYEENGETYISSISVKIFEELEMPVLTLAKGTAPKIECNHHTESSVKSQTGSSSNPCNIVISEEKQSNFSSAIALLTEWTNGKPIDISATVGVIRLLNAAREDICNYLFSVINWQSEGISIDNVSKVKNSKPQLVALENQTKGTGRYIMPANWESLSVISAFIKWREYGGESWNYPDSDLDAYIVSMWARKVKKEIVKAVDDHIHAEGTSYIEAAIKAGIYSMILNGEFRERSLHNFKVEHLFQTPTIRKATNMHSKDWNAVVSLMAQKDADKINRETIRRYFNLVQGNSNAISIVVLNEPELTRTFRKVKGEKLSITPEELEISDSVKLRQDVFNFLNNIASRTDKVAKAEIEKAREIVQPIYEYFDSDEIDDDDIQDLLTEANKFYDEANRTMIPISGGIPKELMDKIKKNKASIARALANVGEVIDQKDQLRILMTFSSDPLTDIMPLLELLKKLDNDLDNTEQNLQKKQIFEIGVGQADRQKDKYAQEMELLSQNIATLSEWR